MYFLALCEKEKYLSSILKVRHCIVELRCFFIRLDVVFWNREVSTLCMLIKIIWDRILFYQTENDKKGCKVILFNIRKLYQTLYDKIESLR